MAKARPTDLDSDHDDNHRVLPMNLPMMCSTTGRRRGERAIYSETAAMAVMVIDGASGNKANPPAAVRRSMHTCKLEKPWPAPANGSSRTRKAKSTGMHPLAADRSLARYEKRVQQTGRRWLALPVTVPVKSCHVGKVRAHSSPLSPLFSCYSRSEKMPFFSRKDARLTDGPPSGVEWRMCTAVRAARTSRRSGRQELEQHVSAGEGAARQTRGTVRSSRRGRPRAGGLRVRRHTKGLLERQFKETRNRGPDTALGPSRQGG